MLGFVVDTARDSSSEGKHRSGLDSGVFSNTERNRIQLTTCSAEEHTCARHLDWRLNDVGRRMPVPISCPDFVLSEESDFVRFFIASRRHRTSAVVVYFR